MADTNLPSGMRWSGISVIGREVSRSIFTIVLAKLIGPYDFGVVAQAMVYVGIVGLLLDQGFSSALIQRSQIEPRLPGVIVTVNLAVGAEVTLATIAIAPLWASFMHTPALAVILVALAPTLLIRAAAVTPRALLMRNMEFRKIGIANLASAFCGGVTGLLVVMMGGTYWALVAQTVFTDITLTGILFILGAGWWPNLDFRLLGKVAAFSGRAFAAGLLVNSVSRNIDNILIGRYQGAEALAFYGLAYRLLLLPVQLVGSTVGSVLFPLFARLAPDKGLLSVELARATRALAALSIPAMGLVAAAAPQLVSVIFGPQWQPAVPIVQVLALAGALQAIYQPSTAPLVLGLGRARLNLWYAWLTTIIATVGIVSGLQFGPLGVAVGYTSATALTMPIEWLIRRRLLGTTVREQVWTLLPATHAAIWAAGGYLFVASLIPDHDFLTLAFGASVAVPAGALVLRWAHRSSWVELTHMVGRVAGRGGPQQTT